MKCPDTAWQAASNSLIAWNHHASWLLWLRCSLFKPLPFFSSCVEKAFLPNLSWPPLSDVAVHLPWTADSPILCLLHILQWCLCSRLLLAGDLPPYLQEPGSNLPAARAPFFKHTLLINSPNLLPQIEKSSRPLEVLCIPCLVAGSCARGCLGLSLIPSWAHTWHLAKQIKKRLEWGKTVWSSRGCWNPGLSKAVKVH